VWDPSEPVEGDLVLTRILWLEGAEEANANTKQRYIYIHGTNQEDRIGEPASIGCVRMRNADVIALYELAPEGTEVEIVV
jgi:lipoprotein-anchoring transpeptidase ErfK/SrfK